MSVSSLKMVQLNMGRAAAVNDQLLAYCQETGVDIALVQEPYNCRGKLVGFEAAPIRCFLSKGTRRRGGPQYIDHGAAIIILNPELVVVPREVNTVENFVSLDLDCGDDGTVTLISGYFKYRTPTAIHVMALEGLLQAATGKVLVAIDANAFHRRWFSRITDARGEAVITLIDEKGLEIANTRSIYTTFHGPRGRTNIDVTLLDRSIRPKLTGWSIDPGATSSDHQLIRFAVKLRRRVFICREMRFNLRRQNHISFLRAYEALDDVRLEEQRDPDRYAQGIEEDVSDAARVHAPRMKPRKSHPPPLVVQGN